ncbi:O-FucT domain protein [Ceratobasidium sp. AG-Ba]|nr:O-FucT domain protein [Ceratobasidium sp. AG-Ba]
MPTKGYSLLPESSNGQLPNIKWHWRPRPRHILTIFSTFAVFFAFGSFFYWGNLELYAYPERALWTSDATDFDDIFLSEAQLPQHNLSAPYPEGRNGRFVKFSNQVWGLGWNNLLQERLLNTILAYESDRAPVFSSFEAWAHPPRDDRIAGIRKVLVVPYNALLGGPTAGAPWGPGDRHPRAISDKWWRMVCPMGKRRVVNADDIMKQIGKELDGKDNLNKWVKLLKAIPENCVEIVGTQVFDFYLLGSTRVLSLWDDFSVHPAIKGLKESQVVTTAVSRNMHKLQGQNGFSWRPSVLRQSDVIAGLVAIHIRRGDYLGNEGQDNGHCLHFARWGSTFTGWCQLPQLPDAFTDAPPRGDVEWGKASPEIAEHYLRRCLPTPAQVAARLHNIRAHRRTPLTHVFVATNAEKEYLAELKTVLAADGWSKDAVVTSGDLELNWQATSVGVAVDMAIMSRAEVFVGNGASLHMTSSSEQPTNAFGIVLELIEQRDNEATYLGHVVSQHTTLVGQDSWSCFLVPCLQLYCMLPGA